MIDGAFELYKQISSFARLKDLVDNAEAETLHLECKAPTEPKLTKDVQSHLAKAASGFANTAGGIIIYGISTTKHAHSGLDVLTQVELGVAPFPWTVWRLGFKQPVDNYFHSLAVIADRGMSDDGVGCTSLR